MFILFPVGKEGSSTLPTPPNQCGWLQGARWEQPPRVAGVCVEERCLVKDKVMVDSFREPGGLQRCVLVRRAGPWLCLRRVCGARSDLGLCGPGSHLQLRQLSLV